MLSAELTVLCQMAANQTAFNREILKNTAMILALLDGKDRDLARVVGENQTRLAEAHYMRIYTNLVNNILGLVGNPAYENTQDDTTSKAKEIEELIQQSFRQNDDEIDQ